MVNTGRFYGDLTVRYTGYTISRFLVFKFVRGVQNSLSIMVQAKNIIMWGFGDGWELQINNYVMPGMKSFLNFLLDINIK